MFEKGRHFTGFFASAGPDTTVIASQMCYRLPDATDVPTARLIHKKLAIPSIDAQRMRQECLLRMGRLGILLSSLGTTSHPINRGPEAGET